MRPVKITAFLVSAVAGETSLPLDSLLYYLVHRHVYGRQDITTPGAPSNGAISNGDTSLPLARIDEHGPDWYYAASWAQWPRDHTDGGEHWSKKFPLSRQGYMDDANKSLDASSGRYKSYRMPVFYRHAKAVTWYAYGLKSRIEALLPHMTHIGKKTAQGWGEIARWEVCDMDQDYSIRGPNGELVRSIPNRTGILAGFRPPYWQPANQALCEMPPLIGQR